jgi:hypothetical protein
MPRNVGSSRFLVTTTFSTDGRYQGAPVVRQEKRFRPDWVVQGSSSVRSSLRHLCIVRCVAKALTSAGWLTELLLHSGVRGSACVRETDADQGPIGCGRGVGSTGARPAIWVRLTSCLPARRPTRGRPRPSHFCPMPTTRSTMDSCSVVTIPSSKALVALVAVRRLLQRDRAVARPRKHDDDSSLC